MYEINDNQPYLTIMVTHWTGQNTEVTVLQRQHPILFHLGNYLGLNKGDLNWEVTLLARRP